MCQFPTLISIDFKVVMRRSFANCDFPIFTFVYILCHRFGEDRKTKLFFKKKKKKKKTIGNGNNVK